MTTPDEIRSWCRNAHPVDAQRLIACADEIERLRGALRLVLYNGVVPPSELSEYKDLLVLAGIREETK